MLLDGNSIFNRAYYALPVLNDKGGKNINAVYGFMNILVKAMTELNPTHIAVAFDKRGHNFRKDIYQGYKATRRPMPDDMARQMPVLQELLADMKIKTVDSAGVEADDIIGTLTKRFGVPTLIITGDKDMFQLVESIKERGVITPATVRQKEDGRYELISGHRRKRACELAGFETLRCEVVDLDRDEATILMVESNFQRSQILPSEKAYAYKMRLDAMKRQAGRPRKENSSPVGIDLRGKQSLDLMSEECGDSRNQIHRYIRLTNLVPELLEFVDEGRIKMRPAVELSYLNEDCQRDLVDEIDLNDCTPSHDQAIRMRKFFEEGKLTTEAISAIMSEEKPNQREKIVLRGDRVRSLIPKNIPINQTEEYVCKALEHYNKFLRNRAERDSR